MDLYLGIDVGSVTAKLALVRAGGDAAGSVYLRSRGKPIAAVQQGLRQIREMLPQGGIIRGIGTTGSARYLAAAIVGADVVKNEISSQAVATARYVPEAQTIIEIGGQDSKIITMRRGSVVDFAMNTVCAAGTGSFLDHQASRLNLEIGDFGDRAARGKGSVRISGQCTVFAESDMIQKQQMGHATDDILYGLCQALMRNYLHNVGAAKEIAPPVVFLGGVAFNQGMVRAFRETPGMEDLIVPPHPEVMGAIGTALMAMEDGARRGAQTRFRGFGACEAAYSVSSFECRVCSSLCEIAQIAVNGDVLGRWGGRCDLWSRVLTG